MCLYEVNLIISAEIEAEYSKWLREHVDEMLTLPGFTQAQILRLKDPPPETGHVAFVVHYWLASHDALERYLQEHAPRLRREGEMRFGARLRASRRVLSST